MKVVFLKEVFLVTVLLMASAFTMQAQAHCFDNSTITFNSPSPFQFDVYHVTCPANTVGVSGRIAQVTGATGATNGVAMEIGKGNAHTSARDTSNSVQACNAVTGDVPSGHAVVPQLAAGPGTYVITVSKDTTSNTTYDWSFHCDGDDFPASPTGVVGADFDQPMNH